MKLSNEILNTIGMLSALAAVFLYRIYRAKKKGEW